MSNSKNVKQSLKAQKAEITKPVFILSTEQTLALEQGVILPLEQICDNDKNSSELKHLIADNLAKILGTNPSYELWNTCHDNSEKAVIVSRKIEESSFKNIWASIVKLLEIKYDLVKPKSKSSSAIRKAESRAKANKFEGIADADLVKLFGAEGKVELAKRELALEKAKETLEIQRQKDLLSDFNAKIKELVKSEPAFALWINSNINNLREQFLDSQS